jgi:hypothetical protein
MIENIWLRTGPYHRYIFADPTRHIFDSASRRRGTPQHPHHRIIKALCEGRPALVRREVEGDILSGDATILPQLPLDSAEQLGRLRRSLPILRKLPAGILQERPNPEPTLSTRAARSAGPAVAAAAGRKTPRSRKLRP